MTTLFELFNGRTGDNVSLWKYFEAFIFSTTSIAIGYYFEPADPLFISSHFSYYIFLLTVITLFYGFGAAIISIACFIVSMKLFYNNIDYQTLSLYILFAFILGEFSFYWRRKLKQEHEKNSFLNEKLEENTTNLFILKTSHDQLEKSYILKPMSIREALFQIKDLIAKNPNRAYSEFIRLLSRVCGIEAGALYLEERAELVKLTEIGENKSIRLHLDDPLVERVLETKESLFVSSLNDKKSNYKAVLPVIDSKDEVKGLFLIKDISFLNLNRENILTATLFLSYFINSVKNIREYLEVQKKFMFMPIEFIKDIDKTSAIYKNYNIVSSIIIIKVERCECNELFLNKINATIRGVDTLFFTVLETKCIVTILLPITPSTGALEFTERLKTTLEKDLNIEDGLLDIAIETVKKSLDDSIEAIDKRLKW